MLNKPMISLLRDSLEAILFETKEPKIKAIAQSAIDETAKKIDKLKQSGYIPCDENDERVVGSFTSTDGRSLCYVREFDYQSYINLDSFLLQIAKEKNIYVDFSDKSYDGDKEAPMDRFGLLEYLSQTPSPTGDRDCEELKKDLELAKSIIKLHDISKEMVQEMIEKHSKQILEKDRRISELEELVEVLKETIKNNDQPNNL